MIKNSIWNEKYRVTNPNEFIGTDSLLKDINQYISKNDIPHLLLVGKPGVGKTTLAKLITANIECDILYINASDENGVDIIREKVKNFASSASFYPLKVVILDEADFLTKEAQAALRNIIESFSLKTRFILTGNYLEKIIEPLQSRCTTYRLEIPSKAKIAERLVSILENEEISYDLKDIATIVNKSYPDVRKSINFLQKCSLTGKLIVEEKNLTSDYVIEVGALIQSKSSLSKIRQILADNEVKEYQELFIYLYENYINNPSIIIILAEYQYKHTFVLDKEINIMACISKIINELNNNRLNG